jgi:fructokinase
MDIRGRGARFLPVDSAREVNHADAGKEACMLLVCGEALIDLVGQPDGRYLASPGGGPTNTAVTLGRLGVPVGLAARLSSDPFGGRIRAHLEESAVDLAASRTVDDPTTLAVATLDESGGAGYGFYWQGTADWQWTADELPGPDPQVRAVLVGSLAIALPPGGDVVSAWARGYGAPLVLDPNVRPMLLGDLETYRHRLDPLVEAATVVKVSDEDLAWTHAGEDPVQVARGWGRPLTVVTRGADGAVAVLDGGDPIEVDGQPVEVVDTVGAGDSFTGGLLSVLDLDDLAGSVRPALERAVAVSAITCSRAGADPPWASELAD